MHCNFNGIKIRRQIVINIFTHNSFYLRTMIRYLLAALYICRWKGTVLSCAETIAFCTQRMRGNMFLPFPSLKNNRHTNELLWSSRLFPVERRCCYLNDNKWTRFHRLPQAMWIWRGDHKGCSWLLGSCSLVPSHHISSVSPQKRLCSSYRSFVFYICPLPPVVW